MLKRVSAGKVESDDGFSIHIIGSEALKYEEHGKHIVLDWTFNPKTQKIRIYFSDANNWDSEGQQVLTPEDKVRINQNIKKAVELLDGDFEVI